MNNVPAISRAKSGDPIPSPKGADLGFAPADERLGGLKLGALHEVFGGDARQSAAATGFAAALAICASKARPILWVRQDFGALENGELFGSGLNELGLAPEHLILVRAPNAMDVLRVAADALVCGGLGALVAEVMGEPKVLDLTASRRLVLGATRKNVTAFLLRLNAEPDASAAETRWIVRAAPSDKQEEAWGRPRFSVALARNRHGGTGEWVMEWDRDHACFRGPGTADSGTVAATSADRPASSQKAAGRTA